MNPKVTEYIEKINQSWQVEVCHNIRQAIHQAIPDIEEQIKYNQAFYTLNGKQVCVFFPAKSWVNITIFHAESLKAPEGFFEKSDKPERKAIKIRDGQAFDYDVLIQCLQDMTQS